MRIVLIVLITLFVVWLLIRAVKKNKIKEESKLSIFEHPSTFKKPNIEMTNTNSKKEEKADQVFELKTPDKKDTDEMQI